MEKIQYKTDVFEGPLDLLLHLINKHKLNINDIPIFDLVEQYTDYVRQMKESDMEIASEFLEMAARLVYIKSVSLLPVYEEAEELKKELSGELIEYRDCKIMAGKIAETANGFDYFCREQMKIESDKKYERLHESDELFRFYLSAVGKGKRKLPPPIEAFTAIVSKKIVSVASRIGGIYHKFRNRGKRRFSDFFADASSRSEMVATFLAMLELIKANKIRVDDENGQLNVSVSEDTDMNDTDFVSDFEEGNEINSETDGEKNG
ncbi:MAG: segregation/condensation protein A [Ruminococcaceae bacterium]|nr:segregation/condensation protein A [Oscillospiraceae bacterium]